MDTKIMDLICIKSDPGGLVPLGFWHEYREIRIFIDFATYQG